MFLKVIWSTTLLKFSIIFDFLSSGESQVWSSFYGKEKRNVWTSQVQAESQQVLSQRIFHNMLLLSYEYCESRTLRDDLTRDRIVVAIEDKKLYEQLQF